MADITPICQLADIGEWRMKRKTELILTKRNISEIPEAIGNVTNMRVLNFAENKLSVLPATIGSLTNLTSVNFRSNALSSLPETMSYLNKLAEVDLSQNQFISTPEPLLPLSEVSSYKLSENKIAHISPSIESMKGLNVLLLDHNEISTLPEGIFRLSHLNEVDLSHNKLNFIGDNPFRWRSLIKLRLGNNQLLSVPSGLDKLTLLTELHLDNNKIQDVPYSLLQVTSLKVLNLANNQISFVPDYFSAAVGLDVLELSDNQITSLPESMSSLTCFKKCRSLRRYPSRPVSLMDIVAYARLDLWEDVKRVTLSLQVMPTAEDLECFALDERLKIAKGMSDSFLLETSESQRLIVESQGIIRTSTQEIERLKPFVQTLKQQVSATDTETKAAVAQKKRAEIDKEKLALDRDRLVALKKSCTDYSTALTSEQDRLFRKLSQNDVEDITAEDMHLILQSFEISVDTQTLLDLLIEGSLVAKIRDPSVHQELRVTRFGDCLCLIYIGTLFDRKQITPLAKALDGRVRMLSAPHDASDAITPQSAGSATDQVSQWPVARVLHWLVQQDLGVWIPIFASNRISGCLLEAFVGMLANKEVAFDWAHCGATLQSETQKARLLERLESLLQLQHE
eukprot:TRINITY_DN4441_c0_g2_i1.p1 TRINITY_DN4441_c0_g2~~TRINITY_DN4441_c0_g2_i1.p1  ORF type:complete len:625 (-),score=133.79 TRINITY_DN4441_c0_g2_i1:182-2056(-)